MTPSDDIRKDKSMKAFHVTFYLDHGTSEPQQIVAKDRAEAERVVARMNEAFPDCAFALGREVEHPTAAVRERIGR